jgi:hypothetical protein
MTNEKFELWVCQVCTLKNTKSNTCEVCGAKKHATGAPAVKKGRIETLFQSAQKKRDHEVVVIADDSPVKRRNQVLTDLTIDTQQSQPRSIASDRVRNVPVHINLGDSASVDLDSTDDDLSSTEEEEDYDNEQDDSKIEASMNSSIEENIEQETLSVILDDDDDEDFDEEVSDSAHDIGLVEDESAFPDPKLPFFSPVSLLLKQKLEVDQLLLSQRYLQASPPEQVRMLFEVAPHGPMHIDFYSQCKGACHPNSKNRWFKVYVKDEQMRRQYQASSDPLGLQKTQQLRTRMLATKKKEWQAKWEKKLKKKHKKTSTEEVRDEDSYMGGVSSMNPAPKSKRKSKETANPPTSHPPPPPPPSHALHPRSIQAMPAPVPRSNPLLVQRPAQPLGQTVPAVPLQGRPQIRPQSQLGRPSVGSSFPRFYAGQAVNPSDLEEMLHGAGGESDEDFGEGPSRRARLQWETARSAPL